MSGDEASIEEILSKFDVIQNLQELEQIESRQQQLNPLKSEIEKTRQRAIMNEGSR